MSHVHEYESVFPFWSAGSKTKEGVVSSVNTGKKSCMFEPLLRSYKHRNRNLLGENAEVCCLNMK